MRGWIHGKSLGSRIRDCHVRVWSYAKSVAGMDVLFCLRQRSKGIFQIYLVLLLFNEMVCNMCIYFTVVGYYNILYFL